jgi:hypothetical protein
MKVNVDKLTFREILEIEEKAGVGFADVVKEMPTKGLAALVWVIRRREQPDFSWDAALDLNFEAVDAVFDKASQNGLGYDEADAVDPTEQPDDSSVST